MRTFAIALLITFLTVDVASAQLFGRRRAQTQPMPSYHAGTPVVFGVGAAAYMPQQQQCAQMPMAMCRGGNGGEVHGPTINTLLRLTYWHEQVDALNRINVSTDGIRQELVRMNENTEEGASMVADAIKEQMIMTVMQQLYGNTNGNGGGGAVIQPYPMPMPQPQQQPQQPTVLVIPQAAIVPSGTRLTP